MTGLLLWSATAFAEERLTLTARWMGVEAGTATMLAVVKDGLRDVAVTATNSAWLADLYPVDDAMQSHARVAGGAERYSARFHEGRFLEEEDLLFLPAGVHVVRDQVVNGARLTTDTVVTDSARHQNPQLTVRPEDPISAFYRIREANLQVGETLALPVFDGRQTVAVLATCVRPETLPDGSLTRLIAIRGGKAGDIKGAMDLYVTADNRPVYAVIQTAAGPIRIDVQ